MATWQDSAYGSDDWYRCWNVRNRVEGSYGVMKSLAVLNYGHDYHHFVGLAREMLVAAFAAVAYNFHMLRSWQARSALMAASDHGLPSPSPRLTTPGPFAPSEPKVRRVRPARGLEALALPRGAPPVLE